METHHNPQAICPRCGKEYTLENVVTTGKPPLTRVCDECRAKMKKTTVTIITYEDDVREIHGDCDFCGQTPCEHCPPDVTIVKESMLRAILEPYLVDPIIKKLYPRGIERYPHAEKYITFEGLKKASRETKETWEYEAELCDRVKAAFKGNECPKCGSKVFMIGDTIIDFNFPFVDGSRIRTRGPRTTKSVKCAACGLRKR